MKSLKALLVLLLAWTIPVQAIAGASGAGCRHSGEQSQTTSTLQSASAPATTGNEHAMHGGHGVHTMAMASTQAGKPQPTSAVLSGCDCACHCVSHHCTGSASGPSGHSTADVARFFADSLRPAREQASPLCAHARDLIRPPSIT